MRLRVELADLSLAALDGSAVDSVAAFVGPARPLGGLAALLDWRLAGAVSRAILAGTVTPEHGENLLLPTAGRLPAARAFLFGLEDPSDRAVALAVRRACEALRRAGAREVAVSFPLDGSLPVAARTWVEGAAAAGFARQVLLGDPRALAVALEGAGRELGVGVETVRTLPRPAAGAAPGSTAGDATA